MRSAMYDEARLFFESIVRENRSVVSFVDADYTFLNGTLATIYGLEKTVTGPKMRRVRLTDANRGGDFGDARHSGDHLVSQPHQPRQTWRVGARTGARGTCATRPAERSVPGKTGPEDGRESDPAPAHGTAPHG